MNIATMIFEGVSGNSVVLNTDTEYPVNGFEMEIDSRQEEQAKVADHGVWESRTYLGQRRITIEGAILGNGPADYMQKRINLMQAFVPIPERGNLKVGTLRLQIDGINEEIRCDCNLDGMPTIPVGVDTPDLSEFQIQLVAIDPFFYSLAKLVASTGTPTGGGGGLTFNFTLPFTFASGGGSGDVIVNNVGNVSTFPVVVIYGPCSAPLISLINGSTVYTLAFEGLVLGSGESITIDFRKRTVTTNTGGSVYHKVMSGSTWWRIPPGSYTVSYRAATAAAPSHADIFIANAYMI